jgi:ABC-type methionine transport system permease subunit
MGTVIYVSFYSMLFSFVGSVMQGVLSTACKVRNFKCNSALKEAEDVITKCLRSS